VLIVVQGHSHPALLCTALVASQLTWVAGSPPDAAFRCTAKVRYRQRDQACRVEQRPDGRVQVLFDDPQRAVTPGQYVVFYAGEDCLGGGVIEERGA
jgi:tRNA-uridine 2-sulfurtransferase